MFVYLKYLYYYYKNSPPDGINVYTFSMHPDDTQPSGILNLGYINSKGTSDINIKFIQSTIINIISRTNKKILLILHQRHINKIKQFKIPSNILINFNIYITPTYVNDDWFWLYASLHKKAFILSNDQSRDHGCMISYQIEIKKWIQTYQIKINSNGLYSDIIYASKNAIISSGIYLSDEIIHIITDTICMCIHIN